MLKAAYPHGDGVEGRRENPEGLSHPVVGGQAEVVPNPPSMIPGNSIEMPLRIKIPTTAHSTPTRPSTRPTVFRKSTKFLFTVLSFPLFSQDSRNNPGRSNEGMP
jgi:hypothetical protein